MKTNGFLTLNFHYSSKPGKSIKTNCFLTVLVFTKIHLENLYHFFAVRISLFDCHALFLSYVCSDLNICCWPYQLRPFIYRKMRALSFAQTQFAFS